MANISPGYNTSWKLIIILEPHERHGVLDQLDRLFNILYRVMQALCEGIHQLLINSPTKDN